MSFKYGEVVLGVATALCLSQTAWAGGPGEEETEETVTSAPAASVVVEEEEGFLGDWIPGTFSGSFTMISDYSFRGVSQTQTGFAAQGGFTWKQDFGLYIGAWASSVNFGGDNTDPTVKDDDSYLEQDFLVGYTNSIGDFTYDVNATWLWYPKESDLSYWEFAAKGAYNVADIATVKAGVMYAPNYFAYADNAGYFSTGVAVPLPVGDLIGLTIDGNVGYTVCDEPLFGPDDDYVDWNLGLIVGLHKNVTVDLRYVDTDADDELGNIADSRFIGGVTFSF